MLDASFYTCVTREGFVSFFTSVILSLKSGGGGSVMSSLTSPDVKLLESLFLRRQPFAVGLGFTGSQKYIPFIFSQRTMNSFST